MRINEDPCRKLRGFSYNRILQNHQIQKVKIVQQKYKEYIATIMPL